MLIVSTSSVTCMNSFISSKNITIRNITIITNITTNILSRINFWTNLLHPILHLPKTLTNA